MVRRRPYGAPGPAARRYRERMPVFSVRLGDGERKLMVIYALFVLNVGPGNAAPTRLGPAHAHGLGAALHALRGWALDSAGVFVVGIPTWKSTAYAISVPGPDH